MARAPVGRDPRLDPSVAEADVRPVVALPRSGPSNRVLAIGAALLAILLFAVLNARRVGLNEPGRSTATNAAIQAPPPLAVPPAPPPPPPPPPPVPPEPRVIVRTEPAPPPQIVYVQPPGGATPAPTPPPRAASGEPALVVDITTNDVQLRSGEDGSGGDAPARNVNAGATSSESGNRVRATVFRNRATTVPQGTLIPAVLETALDSSRPGFARAVVSRDARGFDGSRVLIPRGSRLIGEYRSDAAPGQKRALVTWTRLIRPDGATIALGSPAGDTLGRGGIKGKVDSHFLQRFGGAILQSALDLGVNVATAKAASGSGIVLGLPSSISGGLGQAVGQQTVPPTIRVRQGTAITIFVARDLDFTGVENKR